MQCKDIPDAPVLKFLLRHGGIGCTVWRQDDDGEPYERSALRAMPDGVPVKLARAKMGMLIRRGLANGCACGCRGDFEITLLGKHWLIARGEANELKPPSIRLDVPRLLKVKQPQYVFGGGN